MFAQIITQNIKTDHLSKFNETIENQIVPMFRKQKGFVDEITLVSPSKIECITLSLWESKEDAETFTRDTYPTFVSTMSTLIDGTPRVKTYEVSNSTFHKLASLVTV